MSYTIKKVAAMSGVSVRTLHFYDEVDLLKPAYVGANGYRYYDEPQLLTLQQILFYRELGFELKQIGRILAQPDFDKIAALESHRKVLKKTVSRTRDLVRTVERTIEHLKGTKKMKSNELFAGFSAEEQAGHEEYLVNRFGEGAASGIAQSRTRVKNWTKADWEKSGKVFHEICRDLAALMEKGLPAEVEDVQDVVRRHHAWIQQFWTPTRVSYTGHSELIVDSDLRKAYEAHHPQLPEFMATAMKTFAEDELS